MEHPDSQRARWDEADEERLSAEEERERRERHSPAPRDPFYCAMPSAVPPRARCDAQCAHCALLTLERV